jgi:glutamate formiminotransferase
VLESVPNFSEGRDEAVIGALGEALSAPARLLDVHTDADHHRSVFTLVGEPDDLVETLLAGIACARERIDLRRHEGAHPRVGAADVVPIVPIRRHDLERARETALTLARRIGDWRSGSLSFSTASWRRGADLRSSGAAACRSSSGGSTRRACARLRPGALDERAGGVIVGARTAADRVQRQPARLDRSGAGGRRGRARDRRRLPGVRALGLELPRAGVVQVSMNVEDWEAAALHEIVARIESEAAQRGAEVVGSELVG